MIAWKILREGDKMCLSLWMTLWSLDTIHVLLVLKKKNPKQIN